MASTEQHDFLKLEDLDTSPPQSTSFDIPFQQGSPPPPVIVTSKAAKKRKSWGQELPEPTTSLPPRKRAKTEDEKEQRRIERIKRNRAAAHNSRERKRQETETLAVALARVQAELDAYRKIHGPLPPSVVLPEVTVCMESADTPAPSLVESRGSIDAPASPTETVDSLFDNTVMIKEEPTENFYPTTFPPAFDNLGAKPTPFSLLDPTQHSAAMLCDLQCRPSSENKAATSTSTASWWAALILYLTLIQLQTTYKTLLLAIWSLSPSRTARLMQASTLRLTSRSMTSSMTPLLSRSAMALAQRNAATAMVRTSRQGALVALQRRSLSEAQRERRIRQTAAKQQRQMQTVTDTKAFEDDCEARDAGDGVRSQQDDLS